MRLAFFAGPGFTRRELGVWVPGVDCQGKSDGEIYFPEVPLGRYVARVYLKDKDTSSFRSTASQVSVEGLSIEGNTEVPVGREFVFQNGKPNRPIILRWAFQPLRADNNPPEAYDGS